MKSYIKDRLAKTHLQLPLIVILLGLNLILTGCENKKTLQGYAEVKLAYIAPDNPGVLTQLLVARGDSVQKGTLLFVLENVVENYQADKASNELKFALNQRSLLQKSLLFKKNFLERRIELNKLHYISKEEFDSARYDYQQTQDEYNKNEANIKKLTTGVNEANWMKSKKEVRAARDGFIFDTYFVASEYVQASQPILSILYPNEIRIIFFVNQNELSSMSIGKKILVSCDGHPEHSTAKITYISPKAEYTPPVLYSEEGRSKLVYKIEAINTSKDDSCFKPGQPVNINVE